MQSYSDEILFPLLQYKILTTISLKHLLVLPWVDTSSICHIKGKLKAVLCCTVNHETRFCCLKFLNDMSYVRKPKMEFYSLNGKISVVLRLHSAQVFLSINFTIKKTIFKFWRQYQETGRTPSFTIVLSEPTSAARCPRRRRRRRQRRRRRRA